MFCETVLCGGRAPYSTMQTNKIEEHNSREQYTPIIALAVLISGCIVRGSKYKVRGHYNSNNAPRFVVVYFLLLFCKF